LFCETPLELSPTLHETTNATAIKNMNGTISKARIEPRSASLEVFIYINDQPKLNYEEERILMVRFLPHLVRI
tara:strand:+ start:863 stop:1081 length:219 start_codon:yes stop_codon:yes gene_type:complete